MFEKMQLKCFLIIAMYTININAGAQNYRLSTSNQIGWYNYFGTLKCSSKIGIHTEYQWRRSQWISHPQQSLLRLGVNYSPCAAVLFRTGYALVETFAYGEIPINVYGKSYHEHRIFEMIQHNYKEGIIEFSNRFILEQRFVGRYHSAQSTNEEEFLFLNRIRYMFRMQFPIFGREIKEKIPYLALYNEIFIGFGKNVSANIFDQNRCGVLLGYRWNKYLRIEGGYMNQTLQFGRLINGQNVFQYNNGLIINVNFNFDLTNVTQ